MIKEMNGKYGTIFFREYARTQMEWKRIKVGSKDPIPIHKRKSKYTAIGEREKEMKVKFGFGTF